MGIDVWDNAFNKKGKWTKGPLHCYVYLIENVKGKYGNRGRIKAGGKEIDVYGAPTPNFADFDGDGDLDLICGEFLDKIILLSGLKNGEAYITIVLILLFINNYSLRVI